MDLNSPEFYTIAFVVAMALVALLMGRTEKKPASTYIIPLATTAAADDEAGEDAVTMEPVDGGGVLLTRCGLSIADEETVNLVITVQEDRCTIVEKKGIKRRSSRGHPVAGAALLKCLQPGEKYHIRYESQLNSTWASFTLDTCRAGTKRVALNF
jgi:hypothetical protein